MSRDRKVVSRCITTDCVRLIAARWAWTACGLRSRPSGRNPTRKLTMTRNEPLACAREIKEERLPVTAGAGCAVIATVCAVMTGDVNASAISRKTISSDEGRRILSSNIRELWLTFVIRSRPCCSSPNAAVATLHSYQFGFCDTFTRRTSTAVRCSTASSTNPASPNGRCMCRRFNRQ